MFAQSDFRGGYKKGGILFEGGLTSSGASSASAASAFVHFVDRPVSFRFNVVQVAVVHLRSGQNAIFVTTPVKPAD